MHKNCFVLVLLLLSVHDVLALDDVLEDVKGRLGLITPRRDEARKEEESAADISVMQFSALQRKTREEKEKREALEERLQKLQRILEEAKQGPSPVSPEFLAQLDGALSDEASSDEELEEGALVEQKLEEAPANAASSRSTNLHYYDSPCGSGSRILCPLKNAGKNPYAAFIPYYSEWP